MWKGRARPTLLRSIQLKDQLCSIFRGQKQVFEVKKVPQVQ